MGRNRTPASIHKLEGNRSHRPIPRELEPGGKPKPPGYLTADQRACFIAATKSLPAGVLTVADQPTVERMAIAWATFRECAREIAGTGLITKGHDHRPARHPLWIIMRGACEEMERAGSSLGMSPAARTRITAPEPADLDDPLALLLSPQGIAWGRGGALEN